jgi:type II secretory pathway pseudopilin PulG
MSADSFPSKPPVVVTIAANVVAIEIDGASHNMRVSENMKRPPPESGAFSLVEVTLALGVAAFCLLVLLGLLPTGLKTQQSSIQQTTANQILSQICSFLRADVRLPPGLYRQVCPDPPDPNDPCNWDQLHGHWAQVGQPPDWLYFTNAGKQTGNVNASSPPTDAVFRVKITYNPTPPTGSTSVANVVVSWPAPVDPDPPSNGVPAGSVKALLAVNR